MLIRGISFKSYLSYSIFRVEKPELKKRCQWKLCLTQMTNHLAQTRFKERNLLHFITGTLSSRKSRLLVALCFLWPNTWQDTIYRTKVLLALSWESPCSCESSDWWLSHQTVSIFPFYPAWNTTNVLASSVASVENGYTMFLRLDPAGHSSLTVKS